MMGNELCVNALLAFEYSKSQKNRKTTIDIPLKYKKIRNIILLEGIGYILINKKFVGKVPKKFVSKLAKKYNLPAFGAIIYEKNKITPYVYVKEVDSFVKETSCGSGSIAFSIISGKSKIIQPTGKEINIKIKKDKIIISAEVKEVRQKWMKL